MFCSQKNRLNFSVTICQFPLLSFQLCKLLFDFAWYTSCKTFRQWLILFCTFYVVNGQCSKENWLYFLMRGRHQGEHELELVVQHLLNGAASWLNKNQLACLLTFQIYTEEQSMILASCLLASVEEDTQITGANGSQWGNRKDASITHWDSEANSFRLFWCSLVKA